MVKNNNKCRLRDREALTINQCAALFGIGRQKLYKLIADPKCSFCFNNGNRKMILRRKFIEYLDSTDKI